MAVIAVGSLMTSSRINEHFRFPDFDLRRPVKQISRTGGVGNNIKYKRATCHSRYLILYIFVVVFIV